MLIGIPRKREKMNRAEWSRTLTFVEVCDQLSAHRAVSLQVKKCTYGGDRRAWLLLHKPMPRVRDYHLLHIGRSSAHDDCHGRAERFLAADCQHRHCQLALQN